MTLATKLSLGALSLGSIGIAGYAGFAKAQQKETKISELIKEKYDYILLDTLAGEGNSDKEHWKKAWNDYKTANKDELNLDGWSTRNDGDLTENLKKKCKEIINLVVENIDNDKYKNTTKYCDRSVTIEDSAKKAGLTILDSGSKDSKIWTARSTNKESLQSSLNKLGINDASDGEKIKNGCEKIKTKNKQDKGYEEIYKAYISICTRQEEDK